MSGLVAVEAPGPAEPPHPSAEVSVDICVCTFQRPYLAQTLKSIATLDPAGAQIRVLVADNDDTPTAGALVEAQRSGFPFPLLYIHAPRRNISLARNACLDHATADFVAFVDDDELASPLWLRELLATAQATQADAVLGPVRAVYDAGAPSWLVRGDFHSTMPARFRGAILTGYAGNALLRRSEALAPLRFNLRLGRTGGEDTEFFYRITDRGGQLAFAPEAWVYEPVPASRTGLRWLLKRRFRSGQTYGARLRAKNGNRLRAGALALAKAGFCLCLGLASFWSPVLWRQNLLRGTLHLGVLGGLFGARQAEHYGS